MVKTIRNDYGMSNISAYKIGLHHAVCGEEQATVYVLSRKIMQKIREYTFDETNKCENNAMQRALIDRIDRWHSAKVFMFFDKYGETYQNFTIEELRKAINRITNMSIFKGKIAKKHQNDDAEEVLIEEIPDLPTEDKFDEEL